MSLEVQCFIELRNKVKCWGCGSSGRAYLEGSVEALNSILRTALKKNQKNRSERCVTILAMLKCKNKY
jgi:hypothetical protein